MEDLERAEARLDNIRTVEPILGALRTISLGSWKAALKRMAGVEEYAERLTAMLSLLAPHLPAQGRAVRKSIGRRSRKIARRARDEHAPTPERVAVLVVGSERGLCGRFNTAVIERAEHHLTEQETSGVQVELMALGTQVRRILQRRQRPPDWAGPLSVAALPSYASAFELTRRWLTRYEEHELDAVDLVHNTYCGAARYEPTTTRLIPPDARADAADADRSGRGQSGTDAQSMSADARSTSADARSMSAMPATSAQSPRRNTVHPGEPWPPPIIETDPLSLYTRVVEQWAAVSLYRQLLDSACAEHSVRYQLMEAASQNAGRLIDDLTLVIQTARQQEITSEMQDLAAGAGLVGPR
jgi:F-type H+-transporting ATPase subunit gamma